MIRIRAHLNILTVTAGCTVIILAGVHRESAPPSQENQAAEEGESSEAPKPLRVVGQAATPEEWEAWQLVERSKRLAEKAGLAESFLQSYPDSGLTAHAHYIIARHCYETGDRENFVIHAEEALSELPDRPDLLAQLSFFYAESGQAAQAIDRAGKALEVVDRVRRPSDVAVDQWVEQIYQIKAEANYALGRAYLSRMPRTENRAEDSNLRKSIEHLKAALRYDPSHDYACLRLGFAERNSNNAAGSLMAYGRAVAIGKVAAGPAQEALESVLAIVKKSMPDSEWADKSAQEIVELASAELEESERSCQDEKALLIQKLREQDLEPASPGIQRSPEPPASGPLG